MIRQPFFCFVFFLFCCTFFFFCRILFSSFFSYFLYFLFFIFFFFFESNEKISNSSKLNMVVRKMKRWKKTYKNLEKGKMEIEKKANRLLI